MAKAKSIPTGPYVIEACTHAPYSARVHGPRLSVWATNPTEARVLMLGWNIAYAEGVKSEKKKSGRRGGTADKQEK